MGRLWLIGGTSESVLLAEAIAQKSLPCLITVTTAAAQHLYPCHPCLQIQVGKLPPPTLTEFLQREQITAVIDASHPYAVEISQGAIAATTARSLPYLRYERPPLPPDPAILVLDRLETLLSGDYLTGQRVFLALGYQALPQFIPWQERAVLFARILPSPQSLEVALQAGFRGDRLIALRPPVSAALEKALWQQWDISLVVSKASGVAGGEDTKRQVAAELGIPYILIDRPVVKYPQQTSEIQKVLAFCSQYFPESEEGDTHFI